MSIHLLNVDPILKVFNNSIFPTMDCQLTPCADFEMRMADCLEAYGFQKGREKCQDLIADLRECLLQGKQKQRVFLMRRERMNQFKKGERAECWSKTPHSDAY